MTTALTHPTDVVAIRPLRFATLLDVERRKLTDTRSGRGLLAGTLAAAAAVLVWKVTHAEVETSFDNYSAGVATMVAFLTPLIALLAMTSEWTQRTALTTFTLAPRRLPVLAAKYVAAVGLSLAATAAGLAMAAAATAIGGGLHGPASFAGWPGDVRYALIFGGLQVTMGAAFGAVAANTPVALSAFLLAPTFWAMLADGVLGQAAAWFDIFEAYGRLSSDTPTQDVAQTLSAIAVWVVLPAAVGLARSLRREVR